MSQRVGRIKEAKLPIYWRPDSFYSERKKGHLVGSHPTRDGAGICLFLRGSTVYVGDGDARSAAYFYGDDTFEPKFGTEREPNWFKPARAPRENDPMYWESKEENHR